jgi:hypothetical protein
MKNVLSIFGVLALMLLFTSCEKDEGKLPEIRFITGGAYQSTSTTLAQGSSFKIGTVSNKSEDKDVLKKFNISRSTDGAAAVSVFDKDLSGSEADEFTYDFTGVMDSVPGQTNKYTFTITNRDGLTNQLNLTLTVGQ